MEIASEENNFLLQVCEKEIIVKKLGSVVSSNKRCVSNGNISESHPAKGMLVLSVVIAFTELRGCLRRIIGATEAGEGHSILSPANPKRNIIVFRSRENPSMTNGFFPLLLLFSPAGVDRTALDTSTRCNLGKYCTTEGWSE